MKFFSVLFFAILLASTNLRAEDLPIIKAPKYTQESYTLNLSQDEINNLKKWSEDVKSDLKNAISSAAELNGEEKLQYLKNEVEEISKTYKDQSNIFVRYSLNRSLKLVQIIEEQDQSAQNSILDIKIRLLTQSLKTGLEYADFDFSRFTNLGLNTYAQFGIDYFSLVTELAKSVFDASSQFEMYKISLEYLQWDLYRETKNAPYASTIIKINNFLKSTSNASISDKEKIEAIRKLKNFISQLEVKQYQGAVETNELEITIKNAVEKNKNIDIDAPFKKGDRILYWSVSDEDNLNGKIATLTKRVNRFGDSNVFNISVDDTGKNYSWIFSSHFFRTQGCLPDSEICVGVPVSYLNNSATVLGISTYFGGDVVIQVDKTKEHVMVPSIMLFKKAGCSRNFPVCVGDKLVDYKDNGSLKVVKAVSLYNLNLVMLGKSIYDDNLVAHSLTNGDKIINKTELIEINNLK
jgi:hypothetical protein